MPGQKPDIIACRKRYDETCYKLKFTLPAFSGLQQVRRTSITGLLCGFLFLLPAIDTSAQEKTLSILDEHASYLPSPTTGGTLMLALFTGAMSFALLAAFWLIRERGLIVTENENLKRGIINAVGIELNHYRYIS